MSAAPILEIRNLSCAIAGRPVLRDISLTVAEGETVVLLGRSGSGKTTLLKTVNGLVRPDSGEILFEGRSAAAQDPIRVRRRMGYVIQDGGLFPHWTVEANIGLVPRLENWPPEKTAARTARAARPPWACRREEFRHRYPRQLSGGQKQRVGIARALAADPPLLLMDEPFAALDPITRFDLQRQFLELRRTVRKSALFVTHDVREALMLGSRIALLKDGALDLVLTPREFLAARTPEALAFLASLASLGEPSHGGAHERAAALRNPDALVQHLELVLITIAIAAALGIPGGGFSGAPSVGAPLGGVVRQYRADHSQPRAFRFSLAHPGIGGIGKRTAIIALCIYALLPILRNSLSGILGVDASVRESAVAMGMTARQVLWQVELPLAAPSILAGLRIATVSTIGTATIAAAIGGGGLGRVHLPGSCHGGHQHYIGRRGSRRDHGAHRRRGIGMDRTKTIACLTALVCAACGSHKPTIVVGSKNFTEQVLLGEILAQQIERRLPVQVERKLDLGGILLTHEALVKGDIDLYPEYTGSALTAVLKQRAISRPGRSAERGPRALSQPMESGLARSAGLRQHFRHDRSRARRRANNTSSRFPMPPARTPGFWESATSSPQRPDGLEGLMKAYNLHPAGASRIHGFGPALFGAGTRPGGYDRGQFHRRNDRQNGRRRARRTICTTFRLINAPWWSASRRWRSFRNFRAALQELSGKFTDATMRQLNAAVDVDHRPVSRVAAEFLRTRGCKIKLMSDVEQPTPPESRTFRCRPRLFHSWCFPCARKPKFSSA